MVSKQYENLSFGVTSAALGSYVTSSLASAQMARHVRKMDAAQRSRAIQRLQGKTPREASGRFVRVSDGSHRGHDIRLGRTVVAPTATVTNNFIRAYSTYARIAPYAMLGAGTINAKLAWDRTRAAGESQTAAAGEAARSAALPLSAAVLPTVIGRYAPKAGLALARFALPIAGGAMLIGGVAGAWRAYQNGDGAAGIAKGAGIAAGDVLSAGLLSRGLQAMGNATQTAAPSGYLNDAAKARTATNQAGAAGRPPAAVAPAATNRSGYTTKDGRSVDATEAQAAAYRARRKG